MGGKAKVNIYGTAVSSWLITPRIQLPQNSNLKFDVLKEEKTTVIVVSHKMSTLSSMDKLLVLQSGRVVPILKLELTFKSPSMIL